MTDTATRFNEAFKDGVIDKNEVNSLFNGLTAEDWRAMSASHKAGDELFKPREAGTDLFGIYAQSKFNIKETDSQFIIENDKHIVDSKITWQGFKNFLGTGAVAAVGGLVVRARYGTGIGLLAAGAVCVGGMIKNHFDTREMKDLVADNYQVKIDKSSLAGQEQASVDVLKQRRDLYAQMLENRKQFA
jgi:hypothetical protein